MKHALGFTFPSLGDTGRIIARTERLDDEATYLVQWYDSSGQAFDKQVYEETVLDALMDRTTNESN